MVRLVFCLGLSSLWWFGVSVGLAATPPKVDCLAIPTMRKTERRVSIDRLLGCLKDADVDRQFSGLLALNFLTDLDSGELGRIGPVVKGLSNSSNLKVREAAVQRLVMLFKPLVREVPIDRLMEWVQSSDTLVTYSGLSALVMRGKTARVVVPELRRLVLDESRSPDFRETVGSYLAQIMGQRVWVQRPGSVSMQTGEWIVRNVVYVSPEVTSNWTDRADFKMTEENFGLKVVLPTNLVLLGHRDTWTRVGAIGELGSLREVDRSVMNAVVGRLWDEKKEVRMAAAVVVGRWLVGRADRLRWLSDEALERLVMGLDEGRGDSFFIPQEGGVDQKGKAGELFEVFRDALYSRPSVRLRGMIKDLPWLLPIVGLGMTGWVGSLGVRRVRRSN